ncbi:MAG: hypothetical protein WBK55_04615 [Alphaproteobacteria bacterium]|jgi:hypothetical protein
MENLPLSQSFEQSISLGAGGKIADSPEPGGGGIVPKAKPQLTDFERAEIHRVFG